MIDQDLLWDILLDPVKTGAKTQYAATCPYCGKARHLYVNIYTGAWDCKHCGEFGAIEKLGEELGIKFKQIIPTVNINKPLVFRKLADNVALAVEIPPLKKISLPTSCRRLKRDDYLFSRHFTVQDLRRLPIYRAKLNPRYQYYVIFEVIEANTTVGFVGRCLLDNQAAEKRKLKRYSNSYDTNFSHLIYGLNELTVNTSAVIIVEGVFDKVRLDNLFDLPNTDNIKCIATFGKKISIIQREKLIRQGIKEIILAYDNDAIIESRKISLDLQRYFSRVRLVRYTGSKDASASTDDELLETFSTYYSPESYYSRFVNKKRLL